MMAKVMQAALVVLAVVVSTQACTPCSRTCRRGRECRLIEVCFGRCELFQACIPVGMYPTSSVCPGNDPVLSYRRDILRCNRTDKRCPGDAVCRASYPGSPNGVCCPCRNDNTPAPLDQQRVAVQSLNAAQALETPSTPSPVDTHATTRAVKCPFFASACTGKK